MIRLAGSISYPTEVKRKHGYVTEVTSLGSQRGGDVCRDSFTSLYRMAVQPTPPAARSEAAIAPLAGTGARVPLIAVQAALEAIPAISGPGRRNEWLDLAHAVKDANPDARHLFNQWHIRSDRHDPRDDSVFDTIDPTDGSYLSLFRTAKHHDPRWWSHDPDVWEWWRARSARLEAETAPNQPTDGPDPDPEAEPEPVRRPTFTMVRLRDLSLSVPPREFIYGHSLVRGMLSILGGTGGVGKTSYILTVLISIALGRPLLATEFDEPQHRLYEPKGIVAYYSLEDPMDDLVRRVNAIILAYRLNPRQIWDKVLLQSGRDQTLVVAATDQRGRLIRTNVDPIVDFLIDNKVTVFAVDPFANSFDGADGTESSSDAMKIICDQYRQIVHRANCAGWMAHHFRKGGLAGDADAFRGSTMLQNAARCMETLSTMTKEDAETLGVNDYERRSYMRLENAKVNLTAAPAEGQWFKLEGVPLGNRTEKYPQGDVVGVPFRWLPQPVELSWSQIETTLNAIDAGCENGTEYYSSKHNSSRYAVDVIVSCTGLKRKQAKAMMDEWLAIGVLERDTYTSKKSRAEVERLMVNQAAKQHLQTCAK